MLASKRSFSLGFVGLVVLGGVGCSAGATTEPSHESVRETASALVASAPSVLLGFGSKREGYAPAALVCDTATTAYAVRFTGAPPTETAEGFPAGVAAELVRWERGSTAPTVVQGTSNRSGKSSLSFTFQENVASEDADAGSLTTTYSVVRNNLLSDTRTTYASIVGKKTGAVREPVTCRSLDRVAFACLTSTRSVYVTRTAEGVYHYAAYDLGATTPSLELDGGKLVAGRDGQVARLVFTNGEARYVLRVSPHDATKALGELVVKNGCTTVHDRCEVLVRGAGSPGVAEVSGDVDGDAGAEAEEGETR